MPFVPFNAVTSDDSGQWIGGQWKEAKFVETEEDFQDELLFLDVSEEKVSRKFLLNCRSFCQRVMRFLLVTKVKGPRLWELVWQIWPLGKPELQLTAPSSREAIEGVAKNAVVIVCYMCWSWGAKRDICPLLKLLNGSKQLNFK